MFQCVHVFGSVQWVVRHVCVKGLRRQVLSQVYLWSRVWSRVDDAYCIGLLDYSVPNYNIGISVQYPPLKQWHDRSLQKLQKLQFDTYESDIDVHFDCLYVF